MRKRKLILILLVIFVFLSFGSYKFLSPEKTTYEESSNISPAEIIQPVQAAQPNRQEPEDNPKKSGYIIKDYKGNIAVFENGENKPFRVTDIEVKNLPEADQKELKSGVEAPDNGKLQTLLEDYLS